jgi:uncharacterized membrane protein
MQFLENRYVQLALLTLGIGLVLWILFWLVLRALGLQDFPVMLQVTASFLAAGLLVARYLARRVF